MQIIPLEAVPNQTVTVNLDGQVSQVNVYQTFFGLFLDLYVNDVLIVGGVICENLNRIVRSLYLGFSGDLAFIDGEGSSDPVYSDLGSRYSLAYLSADELPEGEG